MAGTLSGGEQQMLAMGRALMSHPKTDRDDEPSMGLSRSMSMRSSILSRRSKVWNYGSLSRQNAKKALSIGIRHTFWRLAHRVKRRCQRNDEQ